jgi:hypothetical protein
MVQLDGPRVVKGVHSLGCVGCGEESWWFGTVVGVEPKFWDVECGDWTTKSAISPCGLIALSWG